jgi:hypothetical protein
MEKEKILNPAAVIENIQEILLCEESGVTPIKALALIFVLVFPDAAVRFFEEQRKTAA